MHNSGGGLDTSGLLSRFEQLNAIGVSLSNERSIERLLETILLAAKTITNADGGTLYRLSEDRRALRFTIVRTDSLDIAYGGTTGRPTAAAFCDLPLYDAHGSANSSLVAACSALEGRTVNIADAYAVEGFDFSGTRRFDEVTGYRSQSFLTVPMKNHANEVIGVLQLINAMSPVTGRIVAFSDADQRLAESLASQGAVSLSNRLLVSELEALFESFVLLINMAIDEKSPHTGAHCQRVPLLTMLLAEAVDATQEGPFAAFRMSDEDRYELKIAGLLHDCGKVTTPVHVVEKATRLQTIFDRIELIETRFEVLRREAEIAMLRAVLSGEDRLPAERRWQAEMQAIDADSAFLHRINAARETGGAEAERVHALARRWTRPGRGAFLSADEVENLTIRSGTLTARERATIDGHIMTTIRMLESLPWPAHLRRVPEFAAGHHERVDGQGHPKGLTAEQMSVQARIIAIADIFEALTACDRPYKSGMKLSQALATLEDLARTGHIDAALFAVFVDRRVHLEYARRYLDPAQIDLPR